MPRWMRVSISSTPRTSTVPDKAKSFLGRALKGRHGRAIIATKFGIKMATARKAHERNMCMKHSMPVSSDFKTDIIDLYQIHRPDPNTPIEETLQALNDAVKAGKVREIGCSKFSVEQMRAARATAGPRYFASVQNEYSLLKREPESDVLPECARMALRFCPTFRWPTDCCRASIRKGIRS
jgi:aryl-alcohol dehydrogenase-like predicted oxidoreductase